jgi:hypothetical protein
MHFGLVISRDLIKYDDMNRKPIVYAFIDSQNLNLGTRTAIKKFGKVIYNGWVLDYKPLPRTLRSGFLTHCALRDIDIAHPST